MRRILTACIWTVAFVSTAICGFAGESNSNPSELPPEISMNKDAGCGNWLFVPIRLNNGERVWFFADTGTSWTILSKSLKSKIARREEKHRVTHDTNSGGAPMSEGQLFLGNTRVVIRSNVRARDFTVLSLVAGRRIDGILGMDFLGHYCVQLDFETRKVRFLDPDSLDKSELGKSYPLKIKYNCPFINHVALIPGASTNSLIDTGLMYDGQVEKVQFSGHYFMQIRNWFVMHFPFARKLHRHLLIPECTWDGETYDALKVDVGSIKRVGPNIIGLRFLARHLVTFDFPNGVMYLKQQSVGPRSLSFDIHERTNSQRESVYSFAFD